MKVSKVSKEFPRFVERCLFPGVAHSLGHFVMFYLWGLGCEGVRLDLSMNAFEQQIATPPVPRGYFIVELGPVRCFSLRVKFVLTAKALAQLDTHQRRLICAAGQAAQNLLGSCGTFACDHTQLLGLQDFQGETGLVNRELVERALIRLGPYVFELRQAAVSTVGHLAEKGSGDYVFTGNQLLALLGLKVT